MGVLFCMPCLIPLGSLGFVASNSNNCKDIKNPKYVGPDRPQVSVVVIGWVAHGRIDGWNTHYGPFCTVHRAQDSTRMVRRA